MGSRLRYHLEEELTGIGSRNYAAFRASAVNARDLQRYKRLLFAKLDELSATRGGAEALVPGAGGCEACKQPISKARLEAVPWTRLCRECKEQQRA